MFAFDWKDLTSIYAATLSTLVFTWQIFTWSRTGPRLRVIISTNMKMVGGYEVDKNTYIAFKISNIGTSDTTITHICLYTFKNKISKFKKKADKTFVINPSNEGQNVPYVLKPGTDFLALALQDSDLEQLSRKMLLYGVVFHSVSKRELRIRIPPIVATESSIAPTAGRR